MHKLYELIGAMQQRKIPFYLGVYRDKVITIHIALPGQRFEIDVLEDGSLDIGEFSGDELKSMDPTYVERLFIEFERR